MCYVRLLLTKNLSQKKTIYKYTEKKYREGKSIMDTHYLVFVRRILAILEELLGN